MPIAYRNSELLDLLQAEFQRKYEANFAASKMLSIFLNLPGLRCLYTMGPVSAVPELLDSSGLGRSLSYRGNPKFSYSNLAPICTFDGVGDYLSRIAGADLQILGTEAYFAHPGLTFGGWFRPTTLGGSLGCMGRYTAPNQRSYLLRYTAAGLPGVLFSNTGAVTITVNAVAATVAGAWNFLAARFTPSTEIAMWSDGEKTTDVVAIPASLWSGNAPFVIGAYDAGATGLFIGDIGMCFVAASALSDGHIFNLYEQTRALFTV